MLIKVCLIILIGLQTASSAFAQLPPGLPVPPENFATTHFWGSSSVTNIQHLSMGGAFVADSHNAWHGNPAGLVAVRTPILLASHNQAGFDSLPTFRTNFIGYAHPFGKNGKNVFKVSGVTVRADGQTIGAPVAINLDAQEDDIGFEFARRVNAKLSVGIGTAYLKTQSTYSIAGVGAVTSLSSRPSALGGRIGFIYDINSKFAIGATYDDYQERVDRSVPAFPFPPDSFQFHSTGYRVGMAYRPSTNTTFLADYEALSLKGNNTKLSQQPFMVGAEQKFGPVALRIGSYDGKLTGGLGFGKGRVRFAYGFTGRYDKNLPGQGAKTAHALQIMVGF